MPHLREGRRRTRSARTCTESRRKTSPPAGYQFSPALAAKKDEKWTPDNLNVWLHNPQSFAKGTKMSFAGIPKAQDRADVIAYLELLK